MQNKNMKTGGIVEESTLSPWPELKRKFSPWEHCLFGLAWFAMVLPPAAQAILTAMVLVWLVTKRLRNRHVTPSTGNVGNWLQSVKYNLPGYFPLFLIGIFSGAFFTLLSYFAGAVVSGEFAAIEVDEALKLIGKQGVYGSFWIFTFILLGMARVPIDRQLRFVIGLLGIYFLYMLIQRYWGIDWVHGFKAYLPPNRLSYGVYRASGFMAHPLTLGYNFMLLTLLFYGLLKSYQEWQLPRISLAFGLVLSLGCLYLTGSRWPLAVTALVLLLAEARSIMRFWRLLILCVPLTVGFLWVEKAQIQRFVEPFYHSGKVSIDIPRLAFWHVHLEMFQDHPLLGVGYSQRKDVILDYYDKLGYASLGRKYSAHNIYLQTLADSGVVGFLGLISIHFGIWAVAVRVYRRFRNRGLQWIVFASLLGGLMQNTLRDSEFLFAFWMCFALYARVSESSGRAMKD